MGAAVSNWNLARAVSMRGQLGVVSGTGLDVVMTRLLQLGDVGGHLRAAFDAFPIPEMAQRVWAQYFVQDGKEADAPFKSRPLPSADPSPRWLELAIVANFSEVWLAKRDHSGPVGINLLEKIQIPTLASLFGAMLAGVDYVLMGAGIPRQIPGVLDSLSRLDPTEYRLDVHGALPGEVFTTKLDPRALGLWPMQSLKRPKFLAIVSSTALAQTMVRKCNPPVDGLVIEGPLAGGHNAPPRGGTVLDENREPIYGPKDAPDLAAIAALGVPFWMAGAYGEPHMLAQALAFGAQGVQLGTPFAFCEESGLPESTKREVIALSLKNRVSVYTDPLASPTGFPFKVLQLAGTLSEETTFLDRQRVCDLGYLRTCYRKEDGTLGYRCAAEPIDDYVRKGGAIEDTDGRKCICNGLVSTIGLPQVRKGGRVEPPILTAGNDVVNLHRYVRPGQHWYTVDDVLAYMLQPAPAPQSLEVHLT